MSECPECGYSDGHARTCPVYLAARKRGEHAQLSQKALLEHRGRDMLIGGSVLAVIVVAVVLLVVFTGGSHRSSASPKPAPSTPSPAYMLASLDRGLNPDDSAVSLWQTRLTMLGENCTNPESTLADIVTAAHEDLHQTGFKPSYAEVANTLIGMMRGQPRQDCSGLPLLAVQAAKASSG